MTKIFQDRSQAGKILAEKLDEYRNRADVIVLALPRGGVPVAYEVAKALGAPMDVCVVRKLGVPGFEEFAMGAIASGGVRVLDQQVVSELQIAPELIEELTAAELSELHRREQLYRGTRAPLDVTGLTVIIVDDGLATGWTMRAAVKALRQKHPQKLVVAVPAGARATCDSFADEVDTIVVCATTPHPFRAVGLWYEDFAQTTDEEVRELLSAKFQVGEKRKTFSQGV